MIGFAVFPQMPSSDQIQRLLEHEVYENRKIRQRRFEPRPKWPHRPRRSRAGNKIGLAVSYIEGRRHLPIIELRRAA